MRAESWCHVASELYSNTQELWSHSISWLNVYWSVPTPSSAFTSEPSWGLRARTRRCITHEPPRRVPTISGARLIQGCQGRRDGNQAGRGDSRKPRLTGEGDFVSIRNPSKPSEKRKRRKSAFTEVSPAAVALPRCFGTPTPEEKARRLAALRAALADSAPTFQARARRAGEGQQ